MDRSSTHPGPATTDEDPRWAEALAVLARTPGRGDRERLLRSRWLRWSWLPAGVLLVLAGAVLLALLLGGSPASDARPSGGLPGVGLAVQVGGLAVMLGHLVVAWRVGLLGVAWSRATSTLTWAQRRGLRAQVRGRAEVDRARLPLAREVAWQFVVQRHQLLLLVGVVVQQLGRAIGAPTRSTLLVTAVVVVALVVVAALVDREARRAGRFLADHPDPGSRG